MKSSTWPARLAQVISAATLQRFPDSTLEAALTAQEQDLIPLITITAKDTGYAVMYLADRRVTVDGQLFQPRILDWDGISQRLGSQSDQARFSFGNADGVMGDMASSTS